MAEFTFEGEVDSLSPRQREFISELLQKRGLKVQKVQIETLGKAGDNYVANFKKIIAVLENGQTFDMIAKVAPTNEIVRATMGTVVLFGNECLMYNEVLPKFVDLQRAAGISEEEFFRSPECYGTLMEPLNEILLLENLKESNFEMLDRFTPLTNEAVKQILKKFALLHSLSFALKKEDPDKFDSYSKRFQDFFALLSANPEFREYLASIERDTISILDSDVYKKAVRGSISQLVEHSAKIFKYERNLRYSVVIHGDGWTNNFMFRLEENIPVEAVLIDYQLSKIASPVTDLQYMIFSSTDHNTRHQHYYEWIDFYHSELDKCLANFGLKANYVYPRDQLDADLRRYSKVFFSSSILLLTVLIRKTEDAAKMKEAMESNQDLQDISATIQTSSLDQESVALFKRKIENLVDSYREFGYLD
ncbi:uncharacterized protein LOC106135578 [Amyelois transitella]|uniref:uncharacterized protein LOC106135578 n=1 Tax=Amyelois transitella TaxID=680683 RepID=UPI00299078F9|nr:uncharacterized protein LOC106135578 [Amyelois transitella]